MAAMSLTGPVLVVGAGLLGTSIGLALRRTGMEVFLKDVNPENVTIASGLGAGTPWSERAEAQLVVVAVPPDYLGKEIVWALDHCRDAMVTDVGSVKADPLRETGRHGAAGYLDRYVGSHPLAGSERSGPLAASASLFDGRPWAITPHESSDEAAVALVRDLVTMCGATAVELTPAEHDLAVARTSHLPHLLAALVAGRLLDAPPAHLSLSGQGVRDVTRIAAGDPDLWGQIVSANASAIKKLLVELRGDLDTLVRAVDGNDRVIVESLLGRGVAGTAAIPGKHGGPARVDGLLFVAVPDHPGELARLLSDAGEIGVNIEDLRIDHDPGRPVGLVELTVAADSVDFLLESLEARGWTTHR